MFRIIVQSGSLGFYKARNQCKYKFISMSIYDDNVNTLWTKFIYADKRFLSRPTYQLEVLKDFKKTFKWSAFIWAKLAATKMTQDSCNLGV